MHEKIVYNLAKNYHLIEGIINKEYIEDAKGV